MAVHHIAQLVLDLRHPPALVRARDDLLDLGRLAPQRRARVQLRHRDRRRARSRVLAGSASEDQRVQQRVCAQPVAAVHRHAGDLAGRIQPLDRGPPFDVGLHAAHDVVLAGADRDRFPRDVDAGEVPAQVHDLAQRLQRALARDDRHVEVDAKAARPDAAPLVDLDLLRARDHVAGGQLHLVRRGLFQEALAVGVEQVGALSARPLGDQDARLDQAGGVILDHLHVHQRGARTVGERDAVAGHDQSVGGGLVDLSGPAAREDHVLGHERLDAAAAHVPCHHAAAAAVAVGQQRQREPLLEALDRLVVLHQLLVEHVQQRLAGDVGDVCGALHRGTPKRAQVQFAVVVAVEGDADVLEVHDLSRGFRAHDFDRVLVTQVVGSLDRVVGVRAPVVVDADGRVDASGRGHRVRAHGVNLAHDRDARARTGRSQSGALASEAGADDQDVVCGHRSF